MASLLFVIDNKYIVLFYDIIKWKKERKKMLDICLLGTGGMMPMPNRFLTAMLARLNGRLLLIDCGEGTQVSMKLLGWGFKTIDVICFTHFHADHISGLPGILLTIGNAGRTEPLTLIGGVGLQYIVEGLKRIAPELPFDLNYIELNEDTPNPIEINGFRISYVLADHMVRCYAYKIDVLRKGKFDLKRAQQQNIPKVIWSKLQKEGNAVWEGKQYTADMVMGAERKGISVVYCTDSRPVDRLIPFAKKTDLFICEGMYGEEEKKKKAIEKKHMIFSEAAMLAKQAEVSRLWLTHFSPALLEPELYLQNALKHFEGAELGEERKTISLYFTEE